MISKRRRLGLRRGGPALHVAVGLFLALMGGFGVSTASAQAKNPNILVIFGDDVGQANISRYTHGVVGYNTPNIDKIGEEGMTFTDYLCGEQLHGGPLVLHYGPVADAGWPHQGWSPGRSGWTAEAGHHHRRSS
jgi:arylsulfatase